MKRIATPVLVLSAMALSAPAFAGGYSEPVIEQPTIAPAPVVPVSGTDWTGGYAGATLGYGWGNDALDDADDMTYGLFGGYNYDFGDFVLGGELEYLGSEIENDTANLDDLTRLKLRAGYDAGPALIYGVVGAAYANADIGGVSYDDTGYTYGIGVDYAVTDSINVGAELLQNEFDEFDNSGTDLSATTLGARVSFKF
ncbi:MAG: porin family protein [Rhodobacteraceae bacterium]|uniref:outer membrane beta-barrel protein n=1 Tax=Celeribacter sp. HF31 TaxID=2721558 RepID=UPI001431F0CE|nr:outer membrane beta-barrel protein [Celeribacter sp. HF31]NIY78670.1 porin family protein [Celeribacter sp. HF31]NVK47705.1 porin family protein [Paracoccaceae bacterium]